MWLERLVLLNYRNFSKQEIDLDKRVNLFVGDNAQGKTNIIEAIFLLATTKSFRANKDIEMVRWGEKAAFVTGKFGPNEIKVAINETGKKLTINSRDKRRIEAIGMLPVVLFSPESLSIVTGSPDKRRRYFDQTLSMTNRTYLYNLGRYLKAIKNRNRLLLDIKQGRPGDLGVWDSQLATLGSYVWSNRISFVEETNARLKIIGPKLAESKIRISYQPFTSKVKEEREIREFFSHELSRRRNEDIARGVTSVGPHRDDFSLFFEIIGKDKILEKDISSFGSRGEQRIAALALKLVEVEYIENKLGKRPLLLLDDVLSEFDEKNREHVTALLSRQQSVITSTSTDFFPTSVLPKVKILTVSEGKVKLD